MPFWTAWKSLLGSLAQRSTSLTPPRCQHILQRHRRTFLESLENRQLLAGAAQIPVEPSADPPVSEVGTDSTLRAAAQGAAQDAQDVLHDLPAEFWEGLAERWTETPE